jgi:hypothetical protein
MGNEELSARLDEAGRELDAVTLHLLPRLVRQRLTQADIARRAEAMLRELGFHGECGDMEVAVEALTDIASDALEVAAQMAAEFAESDEKHQPLYPPAVRARSIEKYIRTLKESLSPEPASR